jgi:hypothetical protein
MNISSFDDLLSAARAQPQRQRLLFVFAAIELPEDANPSERAGFARGEGGALVPQMCVDKSLDEIGSFHHFAEEASKMGNEWGMLFAAALSGSADREPTSEDATRPLENMVEAIRLGRPETFAVFNRQGVAVRLGSP